MAQRPFARQARGMSSPLSIQSDLEDPGAAYDRKAAGYDRLVRNRLYNRLLWGTDPADYRAFAQRAVDSGRGPLLDVAAGSAIETAAAYAASDREIVVTDRSIAMLEIAGQRIGASAAGRVRLVQADAYALPLAPHAHETVLCMGFMHIAPDPRRLLDVLLEQTAPGGQVWLSSLVAEHPVGRRYLQVLHRAGEVAAPRTAAEFATLLGGAALEVRGSMAYGVVTAAG